MVKINSSEKHCQLSISDNLETDYILLHGINELMKLQYKKESHDIWSIISLNEEGKYIGKVFARGEYIGSTLRLVENTTNNEDDNLVFIHDLFECNGSTIAHLVDPVKGMMPAIWIK